MTFKRSYEITPLTLGHPMYSATGTRYEIVIKEGEDYALLYQDIYPNEDIIPILESFEALSWRELDVLSQFWDKYVMSTTTICSEYCDEYTATLSAVKQSIYTFRNTMR